MGLPIFDKGFTQEEIEFGIEKYVDYQTQFEKSFLEPLKNVLQCIGWTHEKVITIGSFFE